MPTSSSPSGSISALQRAGNDDGVGIPEEDEGLAASRSWRRRIAAAAEPVRGERDDRDATGSGHATSELLAAPSPVSTTMTSQSRLVGPNRRHAAARAARGGVVGDDHDGSGIPSRWGDRVGTPAVRECRRSEAALAVHQHAEIAVRGRPVPWRSIPEPVIAEGEFKSRGPWVTRFRIGDRTAQVDLTTGRIGASSARSRLEACLVSSLERASFSLARVDGRRGRGTPGEHRAQFAGPRDRQRDFVKPTSRTRREQFAVRRRLLRRLLYHLPRPCCSSTSCRGGSELLPQTHYAERRTDVEGCPAALPRHRESRPLSGLSPVVLAHDPRPDRAAREADTREVPEADTSHKNGPIVTLAARPCEPLIEGFRPGSSLDPRPRRRTRERHRLPADRRDRTVAVRVAVAPLTVVVLVSAVVRTVVAWSRATPAYFPDEYMYSSFGRSIANGHLPQVRGVPSHFLPLLMPLITSPGWMLGSVEHGYRAVQAIDATFMSRGDRVLARATPRLERALLTRRGGAQPDSVSLLSSFIVSSRSRTRSCSWRSSPP